MRHNKILFAALAAFCIPSTASAQNFMSGGIGFHILSADNHTVEVTVKQSCSPYSGNINIPPTVTYNGTTYDVVALGEKAFYQATLSRITIPSSVTQIKYGSFLFANCPPTINVPASVTDIENLAFAAYNLKNINVDESNPNYRTINGMLFSKDTSTLLECPMGKSGTITLPQNTRRIATYGFAYCQTITGITLPDGLTSIGNAAFFYDTQLDNIIIPASVSNIGSDLFSGCFALNSLSIANGNNNYYLDGLMLYSMDGDTLKSCHKSADSLYLPSTLRVVSGFNCNKNIKYVHIPEGITTILDNTFGNSTLKSIDLPSHMNLIDGWAFYNCPSLSRVRMPSILDSMGGSCFHSCSGLTSIDIPNGLHTIPDAAFFMCTALSNITWGDAIEVIDTSAFGDCSFTELTLPPTLRTIKAMAFLGDYRGELNRLTFSAPVDTIEVDAFYQQPLHMLRFRNAVPPVTTDDGYGTYGCLDMTDIDSILIPCGSLNTYLSESYWGQFANKYYEDCNSIDDIPTDNIKIYSHDDQITIEGADGETVQIFDITGRVISWHTVSSTHNETLPAGVYLVKIGNRPAHKVTVIRQ